MNKINPILDENFNFIESRTILWTKMFTIQYFSTCFKSHTLNCVGLTSLLVLIKRLFQYFKVELVNSLNLKIFFH